MAGASARRAPLVLVLLVLLVGLAPSVEAVAFADTCACPDPAPCPSFCLDCDSYDSDCMSGKTHARCNGESHSNCPSGYEKRPQTGQSWRCSNGGTWYTMYHCYRLCLGITTGRCNMCQDGYYGFNNDQTCALCDAGSYCTGGTMNGECSKGHYCEAGSSSPTENECPPGTYGDVTGLESGACSGPCDAGYWCEAASESATQFPCRAGHWGSTGQTNEYCSGLCSAGYYCPEGSSSSRAVKCGNAGVYCPEGSSEPISVDVGFYSTPDTASEALRSGQAICPKGHYCVNGVKLPCPAGRYASSIGSDSCESNLCAAGYFCPEGSTSSTANPCFEGEEEPDHPATFYCPEGTSLPLEVLPGHYTTPEDEDEDKWKHRTGQELADPAVDIVQHGIRKRKVEWLGDCKGDAGELSVLEWTNDERGDGFPGALISTLEAYDNIGNTVLTPSAFSIAELSPSINRQECVDMGMPFEVLSNGSLAIRGDALLDYEKCDRFVFDIIATSPVEDITSTCRLAINVINNNDKPYFEDKSTNGYPEAQPNVVDFEIPERTAPNKGVGNPLRANDEDVGQEIFFEILGDKEDGVLDMFYVGSCSGQLYVQQGGLDSRKKDTYKLQMQVCDDPKFFAAEVGQCSVTANITIKVLDVNDPPSFGTDEFYVSSFRVPENSPPETLLEPFCKRVGNATEVPCADLDASVEGVIVSDLDFGDNRDSAEEIMTYLIKRNDDGAFEAVSCERATNLAPCEIGDSGVYAAAGALVLSQFADLNFEADAEYSIEVQVEDKRGMTAQMEVPIFVTDVNDAPEWPAQQLQELSFPENDPDAAGTLYAVDEEADDILTYEVIAAYDADGTPAPNLFETADGNAASAPEATPVELKLKDGVTLDAEGMARYTVTLRVTDTGGLSADTNFTVLVSDVNEPPTLTTTDLYVKENVPLFHIIGTELSSTDVDEGQLAFYELLDSSIFKVSTSGNVSVQGDLNFENQNTYTIHIKVSDNGSPVLSSSSYVTVHVTDEPEPPTFAEPRQRVYVTEEPGFNTSWVADVTVEDEDDGDSASIEILEQKVLTNARPVDYFMVDGLTIVQNTSAVEAPNYESSVFRPYPQRVVELKLRATDNAGLTSEAVVEVEILDANDAPVLASRTVALPKHSTIPPNGEECLIENFCAPGGVVANIFESCTDEDLAESGNLAVDIEYTIASGNTDDTFSITDGVLYVNSITSGITSSGEEFLLEVVATDQGGLQSASAVFTITVTDVNYRPVLQDHTVDIVEGPESYRMLIEDLGATDRDDEQLTYEFYRAIPSNAMSSFFVDPSQGSLEQVQPVDFEDMTLDGKIELYIRVTDDDEDNPQSATGIVTVRVEDVNEPPYFSVSKAVVSVNEMTAAGTLNTTETQAEDADAADENNLQYALVGAEGSAFTVDASSGIISHDGTLKHEIPGPHCKINSSTGVHECTLTLRVRDTAGHEATLKVKVKVLDVNERPEFTGITCSDETRTACPEQDEIEVDEDIFDSTILSGSIQIAKLQSLDNDRIAQPQNSNTAGFRKAVYSFVNGVVMEDGSTRLEETFHLLPSGELLVVNELDFENRSVYVFDVLLTDTDETNPLDTTFSITITVRDTNDMVAVTRVGANVPLSTTGGETIELQGANFGPTAYKVANEGAVAPSVRAFLKQQSSGKTYAATDCEIVAPDRIECTTPEGVGSGFYWYVELHDGAQRSPEDFDLLDDYLVAFTAPVITAVTDASALPTDGGAEFRVFGKDFGAFLPEQPEISVVYQSRGSVNRQKFTATGCTLQVAAPGSPDSEMLACTSVPGTGLRLEFMVTIQGQDSKWFNAEAQVEPLEHAAPAFAAVGAQVRLQSGAAEMDTRGDQTGLDRIVLRGNNFGVLGGGQVVEVTYKGPSSNTANATDCQVTESHVEIQCNYASGSGRNLAFVVIVDGIKSEPSTDTLSYQGPRITRLSGPGSEDAKTAGDQKVYLQGTGFGPVSNAINVTATYGGPLGTRFTATNCKVVDADTRISCETSSGTGRNHGWKVSISGQESPMSMGESGLGTSYSAPTILYFGDNSEDAVTEGGERVKIVGKDFGADSSLLSATFGPTGLEYDARDCRIDPDYLHTRMTCTLPPGIGASLKWTVYVDGQASKVPTTQYVAPVITDIEGDVVDRKAATLGGELFVINGFDFGPQRIHLLNPDYRFTYGPVTGQEYEARNCTIEPLQQSKIIARLPGSQHPRETQRVRLTGTSVPEVQQLRLNETRRTPNTPLSGNFTLEVNTTSCRLCTVQDVQTTRAINPNVPDDLQAALRELNNTGAAESLTVTETMHPGEGQEGLTWDVTFGGLPGNLADDMLSVASSSLSGDDPELTQISTVRQGNELALDLAIKLGYDDTTATYPIAGTAAETGEIRPLSMTTAEIEAQLAALEGVSDLVRVTRKSLQDGVGGVELSITFVGNDGDLPLMTCLDVTPGDAAASSDQHGTAPGTGLACAVETIVNGTFLDGGSFTVAWEGEPITVAFNEDAASLEGKLRAASGLSNLNVTRDRFLQVADDAASWGGGYIWYVETGQLPVEDIQLESSGSLQHNDGAGSGLAEVELRPLGASSAQCRTSPGVGADLKFMAHIANQESVLSRALLSYLPPRVQSFVPPVGVSAQGMELSLVGSNFGGSEAFDLLLTFADEQIEVIRVSHSEIVAKVPEPLQRRSNNTVKLRVGGQTFETTYSFGPPRVTSISAVSPPQDLAGPPQEIVVRGENFGRYNSSFDSIKVGGEPCEVIEWTHTAILCNLTKLEGPMRIEVGGQVCLDDTSNDTRKEGCCPCDFSYNDTLKSPKITSISKCSTEGIDTDGCFTNGGYELVVYGKNLGTSIYGKVLIHGKECELLGGLEAYTDTEIHCTVPEGQGSGPIYVKNAWKQSKDGELFHYDKPTLQDIVPSRGTTEGNTTLTIFGTNFGLSGKVYFANATVCEVLNPETDWSHDQVQCQSPEGQGIAPVSIEVAGKMARNEINFDYFMPQITSIDPLVGDTDGGYGMFLLGSDFGTNGTAYVGDKPCLTITYTHTQIVCMVPAGVGKNLEVRIESGMRFSNATYFSYFPPTVLLVEPERGPTLGGSLLRIRGSNFGSNDVAPTVHIGPYECSSVEVRSSTTLDCISPMGIGRDLPIVVTVAGQASRQELLFHFDEPEVVSASPFPLNALGTAASNEELTLQGRNFGQEETDPGAPGLEVRVDGKLCESAVRLSDSQITCSAPRVAVGRHDVELHVAQQSSLLPNNASNALFAACRRGFFGQPGELCEPCPIGGECYGYVNGRHYDPQSRPSYGSLNRTLFQLCEPTFACLGNDTCAVGYEHRNDNFKLCGVCADDFYRLQGECIPCPDLAWLILVGCFLLAAMLCGLAYFLTKFGVQLAAVSICIDFAQVVSLFASYDFAWPHVVSSAYSVLSAFNLNLELASPECSVGWDYETKWYIMYFMPLVFGLIFMMSFVVTFIRVSIKAMYKKAKEKVHNRNAVAPTAEVKNTLGMLGKKDEEPSTVNLINDRLDEKVLLVDDGDIDSYDASFNQFIDAEFGAFLIMCYYLYLSVMKKCFETFRCTDGPVPLLRAEPSEPCNDQGDFYPRIHGLASWGIIMYGFGVPSVICYLLIKHRDFIKQDQSRREQALTQSDSDAAKRVQSAFRGYYVRRVVDPRSILHRHRTLTNIGRTRAKYGKLYEDFTGECYYWRLVLMIRKLVLVMITMFLDDKFKQSTLAFGVLFASYALQVKKKPYLNRYPDDRKKRRQIKAYNEWKRRAALRNAVQESAGRVRALQEALQKRLRKAGAKTGLEGIFSRGKVNLKENMDFRQLEVSNVASKQVQSKLQERREALTVEEREKDNMRTTVEKRWGVVQQFVRGVSDQDKFELNQEAAENMKTDALRWLFDYNTLETISLATSMYILLFGLLFDTYAAHADDIRINVLASFTIGIFVVVIMLFMSSVLIDVKRKFYPLFKEKIAKEGMRGVFLSLFHRKSKAGAEGNQVEAAKPKAKDGINEMLAPRRGQWVAPVNPFATLRKQNEDLVRAEEARLQAIMASKMRHEEELRERELKRLEEKQRLEEEYKLKMESVEQELRDLEELDREQERAIEEAIREEMEAEAQSIEMELQAKLQAIATEHGDGPIAATAAIDKARREDELRLEEEDAERQRKLEEARKAAEAADLEQQEQAVNEEFEEEQRLLEMQIEAERQARLMELKAKHAMEVNKAIEDLEKQAEDVFSGHRKQQDEIKARLQERRLRKNGTFRRRKDRPPPETEEEKTLQEFEDKLFDLEEQQEREAQQLEETMLEAKGAKLEELKVVVQEKVKREFQDDAEFERSLQSELTGFDDETMALESEARSKLEAELAALGDDTNEDEIAKLRSKYDQSISSLRAQRDKDRQAVQDKLEKRRKARLDKARADEEAREKERLASLEAAAKLAAEEKAKLEAESQDLSEEEAERLRAEFETHFQKLEQKKEGMKNERKDALEKRLAKRKAALEKKSKQLEQQRAAEAAAEAAKKAAAEAAAAAAAAAEAEANKAAPAATEEDMAEQLNKIKEEAMAKKKLLEEKLKEEKRSQRDKIRERLAKKKKMAEEKKRKFLEDKQREEEIMEQKMKEEETALRTKQAEEIQRIEEAKIEVFLDDKHAKDLASGVAAWRKRKEDLEKSKAQQLPKRSDILSADYEAKVERCEKVLKEIREEKVKEISGEELAALEKREQELSRQIKDLGNLYVNMAEEMDAEINNLTNSAAVQKARQKRKLDTLKAMMARIRGEEPEDGSPPGSPGSDQSMSPTMVVNLDKLALGNLDI